MRKDYITKPFFLRSEEKSLYGKKLLHDRKAKLSYFYMLYRQTSKKLCGFSIKLSWILSHIAIHGKNEAYKAAKSALEFEIVKFKIPSTDFKLYINSRWQIFWDFYDTSKLYIIQNKGAIPYNFNLKRKLQNFKTDHI